jgi:nitrogen fixation NifU-like protein
MLEELYQEIILDHYRRPRNRGTINPADLQAQDSNPLCGDEITVTAKLTDGKISELKFDGHGCSISTASASIIESFQKMMRGDLPFGGKELGDLKALEGVLKFPVRVKCATLAWHTAAKSIAGKS